MRPPAQWLARAFRDWPIKRKLSVIMVATAGLALTLAAVGMLASDSILFRGYIERDLAALSQIIADNSTGALAFDDAKAAAETLGALRARKHLIAACIYRSDGTILARYLRQNSESDCPTALKRPEIQFLSDRVALSQPVTLSGRAIGTLTLSYDLREIGERRRLFGGAVVSILFLSAILATILSSMLRRLITDPVSRLVETATAVSVSSNYALRAEKVTGDEMGVLVDAFNEMLARIDTRNEELRQALAAREQANQRLARSNEDLERFAFVASHDLQEPLRMITLYLQLLQKRSLLHSSPETAEFVSTIMKGAHRMRELLGDLRAYAELGTEADEVVELNLNVVLAKVKENLGLLIDSNQARVTNSPMPSLKAYEGHFIPLFQNLIGNAVKYRDAQPPEIHVSYQREPHSLHFAVSDNGIGIAPEYHAKIFAPFKRLHGPELPGSGIGLAICQRVVERYGGRIWVESDGGKGATFRFELPDHLLVSASGGEDA